MVLLSNTTQNMAAKGGLIFIITSNSIQALICQPLVNKLTLMGLLNLPPLFLPNLFVYNEHKELFLQHKISCSFNNLRIIELCLHCGSSCCANLVNFRWFLQCIFSILSVKIKGFISCVYVSFPDGILFWSIMLTSLPFLPFNRWFGVQLNPSFLGIDLKYVILS